MEIRTISTSPTPSIDLIWRSICILSAGHKSCQYGYRFIPSHFEHCFHFQIQPVPSFPGFQSQASLASHSMRKFQCLAVKTLLASTILKEEIAEDDQDFIKYRKFDFGRVH